MALYIKDEVTAQLVNKLAAHKKTTKQDAVKSAVQAELDRIDADIPLIEKLQKFWAEHPLPPATGEVADKAFFDELSGEL
jgi:antitoxin VapB